jgi:hypothetical protein
MLVFHRVFHYNYNYMCLLHDGQDSALFQIVPGCWLKAQRFNMMYISIAVLAVVVNTVIIIIIIIPQSTTN